MRKPYTTERPRARTTIDGVLEGRYSRPCTAAPLLPQPRNDISNRSAAIGSLSLRCVDRGAVILTCTCPERTVQISPARADQLSRHRNAACREQYRLCRHNARCLRLPVRQHLHRRPSGKHPPRASIADDSATISGDHDPPGFPRQTNPAQTRRGACARMLETR